jgi:hypothetical protein
MLYKISDEAFLAYSRRLTIFIHTTATAGELLKLKPSVELLRKQCTNAKRTWIVVSLLQDINHKLRRLGGCYANSTRLS